MQRNEDEQLRLMLSRVEELCERAEQGRFSYTNFLTPREAKHALSLVQRRGQVHRARLYGGYEGAERTCLLLFPDYVADAFESQDGAQARTEQLLAYAGEQDPVAALCFTPSGYRTLTHRDYLGSLLSLGIEREMLGDIAVEDDRAVVLCRSHMLPFLCSAAERIGGDTVRVAPIELPSDFDGGRKFSPISDTVASRRLDGVVAALPTFHARRHSKQFGRVWSSWTMSESCVPTVWWTFHA